MTTPSTRHHITLDGSLSLASAAGVKAKLVAVLSSCDEAHLDITDAHDLDVSFLQILAAAQKQTLREGKRLTISSSSLLSIQIARAGFPPDALPACVDAKPTIVGDPQ